MRPLIIIALCGFSAVSEDNLALINKGKADQAISNLKSELAENPKSGKSHELMALAYLRQNKLNDAAEEAKKALELSPDEASTHVAAARVYTAKQEFGTASAELDKAAAIDSSYAEIALYRGALALARKDFKTAASLLEPHVNAHPDEPFGHYYLGLAQYGMKKPDKTVQHFQRFLSLAPDTPEAARVESLLRSIR
ncbi:hypothetical protein F183_A18730 [Bryobacterales bacterium F-183]|nr:hypothetical protein F183_A18730 [Bryobacterales bacterium F-183]